MRRILGALVLVAWAMLPHSAAASPYPSPSLAQIMLPAPSGYVAQSSTILSGGFTSHDLSSGWGAKAAEAQKNLEQDGFFDGYGITWVNQAAQRGLVEYIVAFAGGQGAMNWLSYAEAGDKADPTYQHADSISGIVSYYGEHNVYPSHDVSDTFVFVKGNDLFVVGFQSTQDDVLSLAISRAKNQYDSAPASSIPSSQWPENQPAITSAQGSKDAGFALGGLMADAIIGVVVVAVILLVVGLVFRYRQGRTLGAAVPLEMPPAGAQMSPDGGFWWDGQQWRPVP